MQSGRCVARFYVIENTYLDSGFRQVDLGGQSLSGKDVRVVGSLEFCLEKGREKKRENAISIGVLSVES